MALAQDKKQSADEILQLMKAGETQTEISGKLGTCIQS